MKFETYIFKPNPKKVTEDNLYVLYTVGTIVFLVALFLIGIPGFGLIALGFISIYLIRSKIQDDQKMGVRRFGALTEKLVMTDDTLTIGETTYKIADLEKIEITSEDFVGASGGMFNASVGVANYLEFNHNGQEFLFQFQVKNRNDLKTVNEIARTWTAK